MKIGIIGNGFVGRATYIFVKNYYSDNDNEERFDILPDTASTPAKPNSIRTYRTDGVSYDPSQGDGTIPPFFKRIYFKPIDVLIYDINPNLCKPAGITLEEVDRECDLLFLCLPTPLDHDGTCYTKILEDTIARCSNPYKIIRSTIPVGFAAKHGCYFMPEFLTEASWENDFRSMKEWIVGIPPPPPPPPRDLSSSSTSTREEEFKKRISKLIRRSHKNGSIDSRLIVFCHTNEAEMLKLMKNCFLSAKVGIMNEFYDFSLATQSDFTEVVKLAKLDERMGTSHFQVPGPDGRRGFGGTCFPKDTHSLYCQMTAQGIHPHVFPAILTRNDTHDRPEREWSRDVWRTTIPLPSPTSKVIVVFTNTPAAHASSYFDNIIRENLSKHNVVIQVVRDSTPTSATTQPIGKNHLIKYWPSPAKPLFFPRVDECYYCPYDDTSSYQTTKDVISIIDLWKCHEEMLLYVVKHAKDDYLAAEIDDESGTEGFDDDDDDDDVVRPTTTHNTRFDYARIFEDYYRETFEHTNRRLVIMF